MARRKLNLKSTEQSRRLEEMFMNRLCFPSISDHKNSSGDPEYRIIYIYNSDQFITCNKCGSRTDFTEFNFRKVLIQHHRCLNKKCGFEFLNEFNKRLLNK